MYLLQFTPPIQCFEVLPNLQYFDLLNMIRLNMGSGFVQFLYGQRFRVQSSSLFFELNLHKKTSDVDTAKTCKKCGSLHLKEEIYFTTAIMC